MKKILVLAIIATLGMTFTGCGLFEFSYVNPVSGEKLDGEKEERRKERDLDDEIERKFKEIEDEDDLEELLKEAEKKISKDLADGYDEEVDDDNAGIYTDDYFNHENEENYSFDDSLSFLGRKASKWDVANDGLSAESENIIAKDTYVAATMYDKEDHLLIMQDNTPGYDCITLEVYDFGSVENMESVLEETVKRLGKDYKEEAFYAVDYSQDDYRAYMFENGGKTIYFVKDTPVAIVEGWYIPDNSKGQMGDVLMAEDCLFNSVHVK